MKLVPFYDDTAYDYKAYWKERKYEDQADRLALRKLLAQIPFKKNLLDIGVGFGRLTSVYAPKFKFLTLVDPSSKMLSRAKKRIKRKKVRFVKSFVENLPFENESFEVALIIRTFHHLENQAQGLKETARVLKPKGYLILEFANKLHLKARLRALLKFDLAYFSDQSPVQVGQSRKGKTPFFNYHPVYVEKMLKKAGFKTLKVLSVSNFRNPIFKKILPLSVLLFLENLIQSLYAPFYLGPSVFLLCQKKEG